MKLLIFLQVFLRQVDRQARFFQLKFYQRIQVQE